MDQDLESIEITWSMVLTMFENAYKSDQKPVELTASEVNATYNVLTSNLYVAATLVSLGIVNNVLNLLEYDVLKRIIKKLEAALDNNSGDTFDLVEYYSIVYAVDKLSTLSEPHLALVEAYLSGGQV